MREEKTNHDDWLRRMGVILALALAAFATIRAPAPAQDNAAQAARAYWLIKQARAALGGEEVLSKLTRIPIQTWNFTNESPAVRHIGPMAQDFYAAFGVGTDDKHIATVDVDGVALAAIQGLDKIVKDLDAALQQKDRQIESLEKRLRELETYVNAARARE